MRTIKYTFIYTIIYMLLALVGMTSCSDPDTFEIKGEVKGGGDFNVYVRYYANDAIQRGIMQVKDGKFEGKFRTSDMALVELNDIDMNRLALLCVNPGDKLNLTIDKEEPLKSTVEGSPLNEELLSALSDNADALTNGSAQEINDAVEAYIAEHPQSLASTALFVTYYDTSIDPLRADSVLYSIDAEALAGTLLASEVMMLKPFANHESYGEVQPMHYRSRDDDSTRIFNPTDGKASLVVLSDQYSSRRDSILPHLKRIHKAFGKKGLQILDLGTFTDVHSWRGITNRDSADWIQGWVPGGILDKDVKRLAVPSVPYYIVTDSAGIQKYRGTSALVAEETIKTLVDKK